MKDRTKTAQKDQYSNFIARINAHIIHFIELMCPLVLAFLLILISGRHIRAARGLLGWTQRDLSKKATIALGTLRKMEDLDGPIGTRIETLKKVTVALEKAGVEFLDDGRPGV